MLDLPFSDESFDVVIEKGTMVNVQATIICLLTLVDSDLILLRIIVMIF